MLGTANVADKFIYITTLEYFVKLSRVTAGIIFVACLRTCLLAENPHFSHLLKSALNKYT